MLSKGKRLDIRNNFSWLRSGKILEDSLLKVFYRFGDNNQPKVGIAVSGKVFRNAVERNRARRLTSRSFEEIYEKLPKKINILAMPKEGILILTSNEVKKHLERLLVGGNIYETGNY